MPRFQTAFAARERRGAFRYDVRVRAAITIDPKAPPVECTIRDISQTGALIEVEGVEVPDDFTLVFSRHCRVARRSKDGDKLGVEFLLPWSVTP
jgi:hypothetical protein